MVIKMDYVLYIVFGDIENKMKIENSKIRAINKIKILNLLSQFFSYFLVGGVSALVEWTLFEFLLKLVGLNYLVATMAAFILSTSTNWILGRVFTFRNMKSNSNKLKEMISVFAVSMIGLLFNLGLMYIFVDLLRLWPLGSKVLATGIVFFWNFASRKIFIYKLK